VGGAETEAVAEITMAVEATGEGAEALGVEGGVADEVGASKIRAAFPYVRG
jgi:hypothetical protein